MARHTIRDKGQIDLFSYADIVAAVREEVTLADRVAAREARYVLPPDHGLGPANDPRPGWRDPVRDWLAEWLEVKWNPGQ